MKLTTLLVACLLIASVHPCTVAIEKTLFENNWTGVTFDTPSEEITWSDPQTIEDYSQFTFQTIFNFDIFSPKFLDLNQVSDPLKSGLIVTIKNGNKIALRIQYIAKSTDEEKDFLLVSFYGVDGSTYPLQTKRVYSNLIQPYKDIQLIASYSNDQDQANGKMAIFLKSHNDAGEEVFDQTVWEVKQVNFSDSLNIRIGREVVADGILGFNGYMQDSIFKLNACVRTLGAAEGMFTPFPTKSVQPLYVHKIIQHYKREFAKNVALTETIQNLYTSNEYSLEFHYKQNGEYSDNYQNLAQVTMHDTFLQIDDQSVIGNDFMSVQIKKNKLRIKILADYDYHKGGFQNFNEIEIDIPVLDAKAWFYIRVSIDNQKKVGKVDVKFPSTSKTQIFEITNAYPNALKFQFGNYGESENGVIGEFGQIQFSNGDEAYEVEPLDELSDFEKEHICYDEFMNLKAQQALRAFCEYKVTEDKQKNIMTARLFLKTLQLKCFDLSFYYEDLTTKDKTFYSLQESVDENGGYQFLVNINDDSTIKFSYIGETDEFYTKQAILKLVVRQQGDNAVNKLNVNFVYIKEVSRIDEKIVNNQYMEPECQNPGESDCKVTVYPKTVIRELDEQGEVIGDDDKPVETKVLNGQQISYVIKLVSFSEPYQLTLKKSVLQIPNEQGDYVDDVVDFHTDTILPDPSDITAVDNGWIKIYYTPDSDKYYGKDIRLVFTTQLVKLPGSRRNLKEVNRILQSEDLPEYIVTQTIQVIEPETAHQVNCDNPTAEGMEYCRQCFKSKPNECKTCKSDTRNPAQNCLCKAGYTDVTKQGQVQNCFEEGSDVTPGPDSQSSETKTDSQSKSKTKSKPNTNLYYLFFLLAIPAILGPIGYVYYKKLKNKGVPSTSQQQKYEIGEQNSAKDMVSCN